MSRKERRAGQAPGFDELLTAAKQHLAAGRNNNAAKLFKQALAIDERNAAAHDGLGMASQALGRRDEAIRHFMQAIALGLADVEGLVKQRPAVGACLKRFRDAWPRRLTIAELFGANGLEAMAGEAMFLALLQSRPVADIELELFLGSVRAGLLALAAQGGAVDDDDLELVCALAQQCFINEYVFSPGPGELETIASLQSREPTPFALAVAAMYRPLADNAERAPPALIRQQVDEPREEAADRARIPALTAIDDPISRQVQQQYEENPYPRWTVATPVRPITLEDYLRRGLPLAAPPSLGPAHDILIAGCGTGGHSIETAQRSPQSRILAVDISGASLAYARRKTREAGIANVEYAQADILKLGALDRRFDVIESVGVLHHLADPAAGFRVLVSLLRPGGVMLLGLYSELARRHIVAARALIAERGYPPTPDGIRQCRQELINRMQALPTRDFYSVSGCRDLLFNVMEHRFTVPGIKSLIAGSGMTLLGFEVAREVSGQFRQQFPAASAMVDLDCWAAFETEHPRTFAAMYVFWLQRQSA